MVQALHWDVLIHDPQHCPCLVVVIVPGRGAEDSQCDAVNFSEWSMGQHMEGGTPSPAFAGEGAVRPPCAGFEVLIAVTGAVRWEQGKECLWNKDGDGVPHKV